MTDTFLRDVRVGLRILLRERAFSALAVFVLALGIAAVTTMFSVVNGAFLRGFSFPNAARLVSVTFIDPSQTTAFGVAGQTSSMDYEELLPEQRSFERMAAYLNGSTVNATIGGTPRRYTGAYVTADFLRILGVSPALGRDFTAADNGPGAEKVALISHGVWQRDFGGVPDIVGRSLRINGAPATIVGVMAPGFNFPFNEDLWIPLYSEFPVRPRNDARAVAPGIIALLRPDVSLDRANVEIAGFAKRFAQAYPETNKQYSAGRVEPLIDTFTPRQLRQVLLTMLAFCLGVLLIACVNVMNMQFARATLRARELAVRSSLGATRMRLVRQMLTESLVLSTVGAVLGIGLAWLSIDVLSTTVRNMDNPPPSWVTFDLDGRVLAITVLATLLAAIASGLLPAWVSSRASSADVLREGGRGSTSRAVALLSRGLVVVQIVVTCILLIGSLLQVRSILRQQAIDYGYDTSAVMSARMGLMDGDYPTDEARKLFYDRLVRDLATRGDFEAIALTSRFRMVFGTTTPIEIEGREYRDPSDRPTANVDQVSGTYFDVTRQKRLEGRTFTDEDLDSRLPVAIVNESFVKKHFPGESPLGRRFRTIEAAGTQAGPWRTIVGVVATARMLPPFNTRNADDAGFYVPFFASATGPIQATPVASQFATLVVRPRGGQSAETLGPALRRAVSLVDPNLPLYYVDTPARHLDSFVAQNRIIASMFSIFGFVAVVLASVGIYGVTSFSVNQRTQEFGVRMALGANHGRILRMVLRQGAVQTAIGLLLGLGLALAAAILGRSAFERTLFGISPSDPLTYVAVVALVVSVCLAATLVPARRATRVDPMIALRAE